MASKDLDSSVRDHPIYQQPSSIESPNNVSANTSSSSSASEVLRRSSAPHGSQSEHQGNLNSSDASSVNSSISSSGSMRVRIKAKYLRERTSPFETGGSSSRPYLPPALPGNLPAGYDVQKDVADVQRHINDDDVAPHSQVSSFRKTSKQGSHEQVSAKVTANGLDDQLSENQRQSLSSGHHGYDDHNQSAVQGSTTIPTETQLPMSSSSNIGIHDTHKKTSGILRQGAPTSSSAPFQSAIWGQPMDVRVTQFSKGQRQQVMRDQLLKRSENSKPTKRYYQPKLIASGRPSASKPEETSTSQSDAGPMTAATAAAAAAVAATVPLLKTQSDLETKMNHIMEKLSVLEHVGHGPPPPPPWVYPAGQGWGGGGYDTRHDLGEMTQHRLSELEDLQKQQREMQAQLRTLSQRTTDHGDEMANRIPAQGSHTFSDHLSSPRAKQSKTKASRPDNELHQKKMEGESQIGQSGIDPKTSSSPGPKSPLGKRDSGEPPKPEKHVKYTPAVTVHRLPQGQVSSGGQQRSGHQGGVREEHHGTQTSPLDTPAPRRHAPRPHSKEIKATGISQLGRGLLEEILSSHDEDERTRDLRQQQVHSNHLSALNVNSSNARAQMVGKESESEEHLYARPSNEHHEPVGSTSPAVKRAQKVAQQLGELNQQVKQTIQSGRLKEDGEKRVTAHQEISPDRHYKEVSKKLRQEAEKDMDRRKQAWLEPAPLDDYLRRTQEALMTGPPLLLPPRSHINMSPSHHNAPVLTPLCAEAQALLKKVQTSKKMLEANLDTVARRQEDEHFYQVIQSICREGDASDFARIKKDVDEQIAAIDAEIKRELQQGRLHISKPSGRHSPPTRLPPDKILQRPHQQQPTSRSQQPPTKGQQPPTSKPVSQPPAGVVPGKLGKKKVQAKIDTGLRRPRKVEEQEEDVTERNKENLRERTTVVKSPPRPSSKPTSRLQDDDHYLKHIYGHTRIQSQRSTLKDAPYLHFANQTPTKTKKMAAHLASPVQAPSHRPIRMHTETHKSRGVGTRHHPPLTSAPQYFFNPYPATGPGPAAPLIAPTQHPSPADGQLIPMAIPLREPRSGMGMTQPVTIIGDDRGGADSEAQARPVDGSNVALIDIRDEKEEEKKKEPAKRDLTIQRLPNVDIDSIPATPASSQERISPGTQPQNQPNNQDIPAPTNEIGEDRLDSAKPLEEEEEEEPSSPEIPGISMEGMRAAKQPSYHGPPFPPQQLPPSQHPPAGIQPSSDQLAAGIRRMEMLQNRAVDWVEQELVSRLISGTHLRQAERTQQSSTSRGARPVSPSSSEDSDHVVGALGGGGLQFFVDAGQLVNPTLVNSLVHEVLQEKIALCMGQHQRERSSVAMPTAHDVRQPTPQPIGQHSPIPTPEPTPPASPIALPSRDPSPTPRDRIPTPEASEMGEAEAASGEAESETESWKDLMKDGETSREEANTIAAPGPDAVTTPPTTPPPISTHSPPPFPQEEPHTPVPSPPSTPTPLVGVPSEPMNTPTLTPEPRSPVASEPEADAFQETLHTPSPEPRLPSPSPLPPPPKAATPAPPSVESSSTTESTPPDSTITHSTGREISEGEWLVSEKEEGRVPDETLFGVPEMEAFDESSQSSTTSTVKGPTDPDKDQEEPRSEGEVDPSRLKLTRDPVVALLTRLRQPPSDLPHPGHVPPSVMQPTAASSPHSISSASSSSMGEVSEGQRPNLMPPAERLLYQEAYHSKPPKGMLDHRRSLGEVGSNGEEDEVDGIFPASKDGAKRGVYSASSSENIRIPSPKTSTAQPLVAPSPVARLIQVGRQRSPEQRVEDEDQDQEAPGDLAEADMTAGGTLIDRPLASLYSTMASDQGTRTMTPDAMNMDAYLQSGYLSQTFSQSEGGVGGATSDLEGSRFLGQTNNSVVGLNASGAGPRGSSLLATSGMFSEDSLEVGAAARGREERMTQRSFQVTLPSIAGLDEKEEESASEGEVHAGETVSDVSEITL